MNHLCKRLFSLLLCLTLLLTAAPALAGVDELDTALGGWLDFGMPVGATVTMQLKRWMPFEQSTIEQFNSVLDNAALHLWLQNTETQRITAASLALGAGDLFSLVESEGYGQYALDTTLLPNLTLQSAEASPMEMLTDSAPVVYLEDSPDVEDIDEPFSFLGALGEVGAAYDDLAARIKTDAKRKSASYTIKGVGAGRFSYVLKLQDEQLAAYQPAVIQALSCGMDPGYRETLGQITLLKGFTVAVYQTKAEADLALYMKGSFKTADGTTYKVKYQWAFTEDEQERIDQYIFETSKSGATDSRVISATLTRGLGDDALRIKSNCTCTLKRGLAVDIYATKMDLKGANEETGRTLTGTVSNNRRHEKSGDQHYTLTTYEPELQLIPGQMYAYLAGECKVTQEKDKRTVTSLMLTFGELTSDRFADVIAGGDPSLIAKLGAGEADAMQALQPSIAQPQNTSAPQSSLAQNNDELILPVAPMDEPTGIPPYEMPAEPTTLALDTLTPEQRTQYRQWTEQNMAIRLILCMLTLPEDAQQLLYSALTSDDLQQVSALLQNLNQP